LRVKLGFLIILALLLSLAVVWKVQSYAYNWAMTPLKDDGQTRLLEVVIEFRSALEEYQYLPFVISQNTDIKRMHASQKSADKAALERYLEQFNVIAGVTAIFIVSEHGEVLAHSDEHKRVYNNLGFPGFRHGYYADKPYFVQAKNGNKGFHASITDSATVGAFYFSAPIYNKQRFSGAVVLQIDNELLSSRFSKIDNFFISQNNHILFASDNSWPQHNIEQIFRPKALKELQDGTHIDIREVKSRHSVLLQSVLLDDFNWQISVVSKVKGATEATQKAKVYSIASCIALMLLLLWLRERRLKNLSRLETQAIMARNEGIQRDMINQAQMGLVLLNGQGYVQFINPMVTQLFGYTIERLKGLHISKILHAPKVKPELLNQLKGLGNQPFKAVTSIETSGLSADGRPFFILFSIKSMQSKLESSYLVTLVDLTKIKKLEYDLSQANDLLELKVLARTKELSEAQSELVQAEKMAALGRMSSAVVHEFNQPLTAIKTYVSIGKQLLKSGHAQANVEQQHTMLVDNFDMINQLNDRMAQLTRQLKVFSFKKPEQLMAVDLAKSFDQTLLLFRGRFNAENIALDKNIPENLACIAGDTTRVEQVLYNLIQNACDAMQDESEDKQRKLQLGVAPSIEHNECMQITIIDSGKGISAQALEHLFEPFFTTKTIGEGLGLGLSIVQSIVTDLGGKIRVSSSQQGTCFSVDLPVYRNG